MPKKGTVTGADLSGSSRGKKGGLTGSKRFEENKTTEQTHSPHPSDEGLKDRLAEKLGTGTTSQTHQTQIQPSSNQASSNQVSSGSSRYLTADNVPHGVAIPQFELNGAIPSDLYSASSSIPELGVREAKQAQIKIAKQENALDVAIANAKLGRKAVKLAIELENLKGDAVDLHTARINTGTKVVKSISADTDYQIESSKLEQKEAQLEQQQIATAGTQSLTPLVREEWELRKEQKSVANDALRVDIERARADVDVKRIEVENRLLEASAS